MRTTVHIKNLICDTCARRIDSRLKALRHISEVVVTLEEETVSFNFFTKHDFEEAKHNLEMMGYPIRGQDNILRC